MQPQRDVALAPLTTFRLGGKARYFIEATSDADVVAALGWADDAHIDQIGVLGGGSNLVVADSGLPGLVVKMGQRGIDIDDRGSYATIWASAGERWDDLVRFSVERELSGLECLSGIPGSVGATPIQNVGAYGHEISETLTQVRVYDRKDRAYRTFSLPDCRLGYRDSRFKSHEPDRYVVLGVEFSLVREPPKPVQHRELLAVLQAHHWANPSPGQLRQAVLELRAQKSLIYDPDDRLARSAGSFFVNPIVPLEQADQLRARLPEPSMPAWNLPDGRVKLAAAWLIEHSGYERGYRVGTVGLSPHHCLVVVAYDRADTCDVVAFARQIQLAVSDRFGVELIPEPKFWGFEQYASGLPLLDETAPITLSSIPESRAQ